MKKIFITGTDTNIGKTYVSCLLLKMWQAQQLKTIAVKPVASGCRTQAGKLFNEDALHLQAHASVQLPYDHINPYPLVAAVAPAFAARDMNITVTVADILNKMRCVFAQKPADICLIEGAGGWFVPINETETFADLVTDLQAEVILVVGMRVGCINHALLTAAAIENAQIILGGWIANCLHLQEERVDEMIAYLSKQMPAPLLSTVAYNEKNLVLNNSGITK